MVFMHENLTDLSGIVPVSGLQNQEVHYYFFSLPTTPPLFFFLRGEHQIFKIYTNTHTRMSYHTLFTVT